MNFPRLPCRSLIRSPGCLPAVVVTAGLSFIERGDVMFLVMAFSPNMPDFWLTIEKTDLNEALIVAESWFKTGAYQCVKVVTAGAVKVKWGPEDPGGVFNGPGSGE